MQQQRWHCGGTGHHGIFKVKLKVLKAQELQLCEICPTSRNFTFHISHIFIAIYKWNSTVGISYASSNFPLWQNRQQSEQIFSLLQFLMFNVQCMFTVWDLTVTNPSIWNSEQSLCLFSEILDILLTFLWMLLNI